MEVKLTKVSSKGQLVIPQDIGVIAGVLDAKLGGKHLVEEVKCSGTGYEYCEFEIKMVEEIKA